MEFTAISDSVSRQLRLVGAVVEKTNALPILSYFKVVVSPDDMRVTASDGTVQASVSISDITSNGTAQFTVPAQRFSDMCQCMPGNEIRFGGCESRKLSIISGDVKFAINTLDAAEFPEIVAENRGSVLTLTQCVLRKALRHIAFSMASNEMRPYLNGAWMHFDGTVLLLAASDGHRMSLYRNVPESINGPAFSVILPRKTVLQLSRQLNLSDAPVSIEDCGSTVQFRFGSSSIVSKTVGGQYPNVLRMIPAYRQKGVVSRQALLAALRRVEVVYSGDQVKCKSLQMCFDRNAIRVNGANSSLDELTETIPFQYVGEQATLAFNLNYMIDVLEAAEGDQIEFALPVGLDPTKSQVVIRVAGNDDFDHVVMPLKL